MSFIDCPQCGHYDSVTAVTCPACGADRADLIGELNAIDQQWDRDRKPFLVRSKHGQEMVPTKGAAVIVIVLTSAVATAFASFSATSVPLPVAAAPLNGMMFAGLLMVIGLGTGAWYYQKAQAYEAAHAAYLRKRSAVHAKHAEQAACLT
jgi:hypothetical protein